MMYLWRTTSEAEKVATWQIERCRANSSRLLVLQFAHFTGRHTRPSSDEPFGSPQLYPAAGCAREDMNILAFGLCLVKIRHLGMDRSKNLEVTDGEETPNELALRYHRPSCATIWGLSWMLSILTPKSCNTLKLLVVVR